jgi:hypothetical protein
MKNIQQLFIHGASWFAAESFYYRLLYTTHTILLYSVIDTRSFGYIGTLFSSVYLLISLFDFGLAKSWGPFFSEASKSKGNFKRMVWHQGIIHIIWLIIVLLIIFIGYNILPSYISWPKVSIPVLLLLIAIFFLEGIKIIFKAILQLGFYYKETAQVEMLSITIFFILVWGIYAITAHIGPELIFCAMSIGSVCSVFLVVYYFVRWYRILPEDSFDNPSDRLLWRLLKNRGALYANSLFGTVIFSSNFLVPLIALYGGFEYISIYKVMSNLTQSISLIIQHIFSPTSTSILAHLKKNSWQEKRETFGLITGRLYHVLGGIMIFMLINHHKILRKSAIHSEGSLTILLFFCILFTENFFITYTSLYVTQERSHYLLACNIIPWCFLLITWQCISCSFFMFLFLLVCARTTSLLLLSIDGYYTWRIKPSLSYQLWWYLGIYLFVSCIFYMLIS